MFFPVEDNLGVVNQIYRHFELPLPEAAEQALRSHARSNPKGKHGAHEYDLEQYGLTPQRVRERFAAYTERYALPCD